MGVFASSVWTCDKRSKRPFLLVSTVSPEIVLYTPGSFLSLMDKHDTQQYSQEHV